MLKVLKKSNYFTEKLKLEKLSDRRVARTLIPSSMNLFIVHYRIDNSKWHSLRTKTTLKYQKTTEYANRKHI